jgi:hypothetical protein
MESLSAELIAELEQTTEAPMASKLRAQQRAKKLSSTRIGRAFQVGIRAEGAAAGT